MKAAEKIAGVKQISIVHGVGETVTDVTSSGDRMGFVIVQADCYEDAIAALDQVMETITIEIAQ